MLRAGLWLAVLGAGLGLLAFRATTLWLESSLPPVQSVSDYRDSALQTTRVYAADGSLVAEWWRERRTLVLGDRIPRHVRLAAVAAEDGDFYEHEGLDFPGMLRALWVNVRERRYSQGASTITQQVARSFYLSQEKTLTRKVLEVFCARKLERHLGKDEILELYLNQIYFGHGRWGIAEAARHYLAKEVSALDVADAALLMGLVPAPERLNPFDAPEAARERRDRVIDRMVQRRFLGESDARQARALGLRLGPRTPERVSAPWFVDVVRRRLESALGQERVLTGGLRVDTTLQTRAQAALDASIREHLGDAEEAPQVAAVLMDPETRGVLALSGGTDFERSPYNRAVQARRQAGSTFKPFVYGAGLERGTFDEQTTWVDRVICYPGARRRWCPDNAGGRHTGEPVTLADALTGSLNVVAVQAMRDVGIGPVTDFARRAGVRSPIPANLTTALGSPEVTVFELVNAYATFAAGGVAGTPVLIRRVEAPDGQVIFSESAAPHRATSSALAARLTALLERVVAEGTGQAAALDGVAVAGKTGTTNDRHDTWFVGYTRPTEGAAVVGGVWVGHDRPAPVAGGSGGRTAAPIWADAVGGWLGLPPSFARAAPAGLGH